MNKKERAIILEIEKDTKSYMKHVEKMNRISGAITSAFVDTIFYSVGMFLVQGHSDNLLGLAIAPVVAFSFYFILDAITDRKRGKRK